jgi:CRP/FNR family transcriptional regulator, cyclic AMP receptor protein
MTPVARPVFNAKSFLAKVGKGRTRVDQPKDHNVFSQGDAADAIFYIQRDRGARRQLNPGADSVLKVTNE